MIFTDGEEDRCGAWRSRSRSVARRPFTGLVSDSDPLPLRDACADAGVHGSARTWLTSAGDGRARASSGALARSTC